jgi:hypothetical protein
MTDKELYTKVRAIGMKITKCDGEYRVNFRNGKEATAYYTTAKDDALLTAEAMMRRRLAQAGWTDEAIENTLHKRTEAKP